MTASLPDFSDLADCRVAIVHDWLVSYAGSERVVEQMFACFPQADVFATVDFFPPEQRRFLAGKSVTTTFIQKLPFAKTRYRNYLPLMPFAIEQLDLSGYDLVLSSSHAVAKGVITGPDQLHICYCHSPMRYAWDMQAQYLQESGLERGFKGLLTRLLLHRIRIWDRHNSAGVDKFIANSGFIARRIEKTYRREAAVIYPCVAIEDFEVCTDKDDFYLTASRLVPYKKIELIVRAFAKMPDRRLVVIGDGPCAKDIGRNVPPNVTLMGYQSFSVLKDHMQRAKAFVFAAEEDFGILPVEAQACGTPVIAFSKGGLLETVVDGVSGLFFDTQTEEAVVEAIGRFEDDFDTDVTQIRANAERFSTACFKRRYIDFVLSCYREQKSRPVASLTE